jgi:hypothetical protein
MNFFDDFALFYESTRSPAARINKRYHAIIEAHKDIFAGKHVLDIASHDGRWSFAAVKAGCTSVIGIEGRQHFVDSAVHNFTNYGIDPAQFRFIRADVVEYLRHSCIKVDVVLLLGFYYHIHCHADFAALVAGTGASRVVLDTAVAPDDDPVIRLWDEPTALQANAIGDRPTALVGAPSRSAVRLMFLHAGFNAQEIDWCSILNQYGPEGVEDYRDGTRTTFLLQRRPAHA